ncbi:hypothetical protein [Brevibacterium sp. FME37]|nr:hypothetical protein [Brevibacterium sp. FME37]
MPTSPQPNSPAHHESILIAAAPNLGAASSILVVWDATDGFW